MKHSSKLDQLGEQYRLNFNPDTSSAVRNLFDWMEKEALRLQRDTKGKTMEETYALTNQANGIIKVREHIEQIKSVASPKQ